MGFGLVGLTEALSYPSPQVRALLDYAKTWQMSDNTPDRAHYPPSYQPKVQPPLTQTLGPDGISRLVKDYLAAGMTAKQLAVKYGYGVTTIKRVLREQGARRMPGASRRQR